MSGSYSKKISPSNITAEKHFLGACLLDSSIVGRFVDRLHPSEFYSPKHEQIWSAMVQQFSKQEPIDIASLSPYMRHEELSSSYLAGLMADVPSTLYSDAHVESIKSTARRRSVIQAAGKIVAAAYEENDPGEAENRAKEILLKAIGNQEGDNTLVTPARQAEILREYILSKSNGTPLSIATGLASLDSDLGGGLRRGNLIIIAARTSVGKSTLAECIAENVAKSEHSVLFVSLEMSPEEILHRYAVRSAMLSDAAPQYGIDNPSDATALEELARKRGNLPFYLLNAPSASTMSIRSAISRVNMQYGGLDLVVVDYLQLLKDQGRQEERLRIGEITANIKSMAREFNVPIILLSQLNRNIEMRGGEPRLADMLESGRIEADADVVIMLWRLDKPDILGYDTKMKIAKNRQGHTGPVDVVFNKPKFMFSDKNQ